MAPSSLLLRHVAVIGAGASGLLSARELRREGHSVVVFERGSAVGGTWMYTPETESDPLGLNPVRPIVSSLYASLRTNLPRECMGFLDYPFIAAVAGGGDHRRFPCHQEVLRYLEDFARDFEIGDVVRLRTEVVRVEMEEDGKWAVISMRVSDCSEATGGEEKDVFDAVVVCNGHYSKPLVADIPGIDAWPGKQMHCHNYRVPEPFQDQVVIIIGSSYSAIDISRDIASFAKEVHISSRSEIEQTPRKQPGYDNMWIHSMIERSHEDGMVVFQDGSSARVDVIIHCTGYKYQFPFLRTDGIVTVDDNRVGPLYQHIFPPLLAPCLSFIGLPWMLMPFPTYELQSKYVAGVLSGRIALPTREDMMDDAEQFYLKMEAAGWPKRYTHNIVQYQSEYTDWLTNEAGCCGMEDWRKLMYVEACKNKTKRPENYRDEWDDDHLVGQAHEDFKRFL